MVTNSDVKAIVNEIYNGLELNNFATLDAPDEKLFDEPLMGVAAGNDPYFAYLKEHIGEFHWSPKEVLELKYGEAGFDPDKIRVISLVFPQTMETKKMQNEATVFPSDRWLVSRGEWEPMAAEFSGKFEKKMDELGIRCASIDLRPEFSRQISENWGIASKWSHRHTAFAAGMGTFGLSDGFISERGKAIRLISIIIEAPLEVTDRGDRGHYDWCLYHSKGICGACIKRCPVDAITKEKGHDKVVCAGYEDIAVAKYYPKHIDGSKYIFGCGLCQSKVPCRDKRP